MTAQAPNPRTRARARQRDEAKKAADNGEDAVVITVNGDRYPLRFSALSIKDVRECRKTTGMSPQGVVRALNDDPDIDLIATMMWLSLRQQGEPVTYDEVCSGLDYSAELEVETKLKPGDEDPDSPEA